MKKSEMIKAARVWAIAVAVTAGSPLAAANFSEIDKNKDNRLQASEMVETFGARAETFMARWDTNNDGALSRREVRRSNTVIQGERPQRKAPDEERILSSDSAGNAIQRVQKTQQEKSQRNDANNDVEKKQTADERATDRNQREAQKASERETRKAEKVAKRTKRQAQREKEREAKKAAKKAERDAARARKAAAREAKQAIKAAKKAERERKAAERQAKQAEKPLRRPSSRLSRSKKLPKWPNVTPRPMVQLPTAKRAKMCKQKWKTVGTTLKPIPAVRQ